MAECYAILRNLICNNKKKWAPEEAQIQPTIEPKNCYSNLLHSCTVFVIEKILLKFRFAHRLELIQIGAAGIAFILDRDGEGICLLCVIHL